MCQWELDSSLGELDRVGSSQVLGSDDGRSDNLDRSRTSTVSTSHFIVELADGASEFDVSEFPIHVVSTRSGGVSEPDAIVLDNA